MEQPKDRCICPKFCQAVDILGRRWTCLILSILLEGPKRFSELEHSVPGIGGRMLSERLKALEAHDIIERVAQPGMPARTEYRLTDKGSDLRPAIHAIEVWANSWEILAGPGAELALAPG